MQICLLLDDPSCAEVLEIFIPTIAKRNTCEKQLLPVRVYYGALFGHWKWFEDMEFINATSTSIAEFLPVGRQMETE
jgi:hypothetical protein